MCTRNTNEKLVYGRMYYNEGKGNLQKYFLSTCMYTNDYKGDGVTLKFLLNLHTHIWSYFSIFSFYFIKCVSMQSVLRVIFS